MHVGLAVLIAIVVLGQVFAVAPLVTFTQELPGGVALEYPPLYTLITPLSAIADRLSLIDVQQFRALAVFLLVIWIVLRLRAWLKRPLREAGYLALYVVSILAVLLYTVWTDRPTARLVVQDPNVLVFNTHSHTSYSHDGADGFTSAENARWHRRAGFHAGFITDHDTHTGALEGVQAFPGPYSRNGFVQMSGVELSLRQVHLVVLGCGGEGLQADDWPKRDDISRAIAFVHACGGKTIASLPEYRRYHNAEWLVAQGIDGFEILNGAPQGMDLPAAVRRQALQLARDHALATLAVTDNHGFGATAPGWNLLELPGWQNLPSTELEAAVLANLNRAIPIGRARVETPESMGALVLDTLAQLWLTLRVLTPTQTVVCVVWLVLFATPGVLRRRTRG